MSILPGDGKRYTCAAVNRDFVGSTPTQAAQTYAIRLPDGEEVEWTAEQLADYDGDWHVNLTVEQADTLMQAIMSDEGGE